MEIMLPSNHAEVPTACSNQTAKLMQLDKEKSMQTDRDMQQLGLNNYYIKQQPNDMKEIQ